MTLIDVGRIQHGELYLDLLVRHGFQSQHGPAKLAQRVLKTGQLLRADGGIGRHVLGQLHGLFQLGLQRRDTRVGIGTQIRAASILLIDLF